MTYLGDFCLRCDGLHSLKDCPEKEIKFKERVERGDFGRVGGEEGERELKRDFKLSRWKVEGGRGRREEL